MMWSLKALKPIEHDATIVADSSLGQLAVGTQSARLNNIKSASPFAAYLGKSIVNIMLHKKDSVNWILDKKLLS